MNEIYTDLEVDPQDLLKVNNNNTKRVFSTGAVRESDSSKEDYVETISYLALQRFAKYMTSKQALYGEGNWRKGIPIKEYEKSLQRHLQKYFANKYDGASLEIETDHLAAALFNLQGILHEEEKALFKPTYKQHRIEDETKAVQMLFESGNKPSKISKVLGIPIRTVYRRVHNAYKSA